MIETRKRDAFFFSHLRQGVAILFTFFALLFFPDNSLGQQNQPFPPSLPTEKNDPDRQPGSFGEMVVRQQISRRRKEHEDLLKRGQEALKLTEELERSFLENETVLGPDVQKLQALEKIVSKIRKDLGGDEDDDLQEDSTAKENFARQNVAAAFAFLKDSTRTLVDELKRTTRFSISAMAIQTSNIVIRFAKFLRLKK